MTTEIVDEAFLIPRMLESLRSEPHRVFDTSFVNLIDTMMHMFHDQFPHEKASMASNWSNFSGGLSRFLFNFLRVQDCFCDSPSGTCLEIHFDFQYSDSILIASGDVAWQVPGVRFLSLPDVLSTDEEYRITPFVLSDFPAPVQSQLSNQYIDNVVYTICRSPLNFNWDSRKRCFKAIVPECQDVSTSNIMDPSTKGQLTQNAGSGSRCRNCAVRLHDHTIS